jgi:hypothetical protein
MRTASVILCRFSVAGDLVLSPSVAASDAMPRDRLRRVSPRLWWGSEGGNFSEISADSVLDHRPFSVGRSIIAVASELIFHGIFVRAGNAAPFTDSGGNGEGGFERSPKNFFIGWDVPKRAVR